MPKKIRHFRLMKSDNDVINFSRETETAIGAIRFEDSVFTFSHSRTEDGKEVSCYRPAVTMVIEGDVE